MADGEVVEGGPRQIHSDAFQNAFQNVDIDQ